MAEDEALDAELAAYRAWVDGLDERETRRWTGPGLVMRPAFLAGWTAANARAVRLAEGVADAARAYRDEHGMAGCSGTCATADRLRAALAALEPVT